MSKPEQEELIIKTERLLLRPLRLSDAPDVHVLRTSPDVMKWTPHPIATSVSQSEEWIAGCLNRSNCYNFVIQELEATEPKVIGIVGAIRTPEVGYILHEDYWGKGYLTEALRGFLPALWEHTKPENAPDGKGSDYSEGKVDPENIASRRVLEKCGYVLWELRKQDFHSPTMGMRDTVVYRIPRPGTTLEPSKYNSPPAGVV